MLLRLPLYAFVLAQIVLDQGSLDDPGTAVQALLEAITSGNWKLALPILMVLLIQAFKKFLLPNLEEKYPILGDKRFMIALAVLGTALTVIIPSLASGGVLTIPLVVNAIGAGIMTVGVFSTGKNWKEAVAESKRPSGGVSAVIGGDKLK